MTQPTSTQQLTDGQRSEILEKAIQAAASNRANDRTQFRIESRSSTQAIVLTQGRGLGVLYHIGCFFLTIATGGFGLILWIFLAFSDSKNRVFRYQYDVSPAGKVTAKKIKVGQIA